MREIWRLILSDYRAGYAYKGESPRRLQLLALPRLLTNASLHANILLRLMVGSPRWMSHLWRRLLISSHSCDIGRDVAVGPGLELPHPFGIVLGTNSRIGANVCIHHGVTVAPVRARWVPGETDPSVTVVIEDGVILYPYCQVLGVNKRVGAGAQVGALQILTDDLAAGEFYGRSRATRGAQREGYASR